jgi:hypothetical protein
LAARSASGASAVETVAATWLMAARSLWSGSRSSRLVSARAAAGPSTSPSPASFTEQQVADAKTRACTAFDTVQKGITLQTNGDGGSDPALTEAVAANARLSLASGSWYLRDHIDAATSEPLYGAVHSLSSVLLDLAANYLAGAKDADPSQADLLKRGESGFARVTDLCK